MNHLYRQFEQSVRWNAISGTLYHALLLGHQLALFAWVGRELYGVIGALFSALYLVITFTNLGLDTSLPAFFHLISADKSTAKRFLLIHSIPECILLLMTAIAGGLYGLYGHLQLDTALVIIMGALLIIEGIRKTVRSVLQLAFLNRPLAFIEISTVLGYIATVWVTIMLGYSVQLIHIFLPMLIFSLAGVSAKLLLLSQWLTTLPTASTAPLPHYRIIKNRLFNYATHVGHAVFSSNFLVPLCALRFGMGSAGLFKIISSIVQALSSVVRTVFGQSGTALFAHLRTMTLNHKRHAFSMVTHKLHITLYAFLAFVITSLYACSYVAPSYMPHTHTMGIIAYCIIILSEHFFMMYEAFYITEEKPLHLFAFTALSLTLLATIVLHAPLHSPLSLLLALLIGRICLFILISTCSFHLWRIVPTWWHHRHSDSVPLEIPRDITEIGKKTATD